MNINVRTRRRQLLTTVSAAALMLAVSNADSALATQTDGRPLLWIEAGWNFEKFSGIGDPYAPPFVLNTPWASTGLRSPLVPQNMSLFSYGADGTITFQPEGSDWVFSAGVRYGRSHGRKHIHDQHNLGQYNITFLGNIVVRTPDIARFSDTTASNGETHVIADFRVGKDVGLGRFGHGTSNIGFSLRYAQFTSKSDVTIHAKPNIDVRLIDRPPIIYNFPFKYYHTYAAAMHAQRSFSGIGPSISWNGSAPILGGVEDGEVTVDWGVNAALLFGRQKAHVQHHETAYYFSEKYKLQHYSNLIVQYTSPHAFNKIRQKTVLVPNLGGFAGLSVRYSDAKISLGYRGDFFFGAMDGGIDTRHSMTRGFSGPFASISIGMGD